MGRAGGREGRCDFRCLQVHAWVSCMHRGKFRHLCGMREHSGAIGEAFQCGEESEAESDLCMRMCMCACERVCVCACVRVCMC